MERCILVPIAPEERDAPIFIARVSLMANTRSPRTLATAINTQFEEFEPYISPDQKYLIFMTQRPDGRGGSDLYISYQRDGAWTKAANIGDKINSSGAEYSPIVTPDGKYFFWSSTRSLPSTSQTKRLTYPDLLNEVKKSGQRSGRHLSDRHQRFEYSTSVNLQT